MTISPSRGLAQESIADLDPELWEAMLGERRRQHDKIELIASENYVSAAVMEAQGSWLTNKYAEGLPGKRYYGGCEFVDIAETLAQERALALYPGAEHVNVQPHSGAQANMAAYFSVLQPGDRILGHEPGPRRPPHPRHEAQLQRQALRGACLRRPPGHRADRLRRDGGAGPRGPAQAHRRRRQRLSAPVGLRADGGHRPRGRRAAVRRHGPRRRSRRGGRPPEPVPACRHRHDDDAQDAARPARRPDLLAPRAARGRGPGELPGAEGRHSARRSTRPSSPGCRAARSCT